MEIDKMNKTLIFYISNITEHIIQIPVYLYLDMFLRWCHFSFSWHVEREWWWFKEKIKVNFKVNFYYYLTLYSTEQEWQICAHRVWLQSQRICHFFLNSKDKREITFSSFIHAPLYHNQVWVNVSIADTWNKTPSWSWIEEQNNSVKKWVQH